ncbi:hypothetical protein ACRJ4W_03140 [Streptomyces sp. GLT-R25]
MERTGDGLEVVFTVRNTGRRDGVDIPQVYVGASPDLQVDQAENGCWAAISGSR